MTMRLSSGIPARACGEAEIRVSKCCDKEYVYCRKYKCGVNSKGTTCERCKLEGDAYWRRIRTPTPCSPCQQQGAQQ